MPRPYGVSPLLIAAAAGLQGFGGEVAEAELIAGMRDKPGGPLAELGGANGVRAIDDRHNSIQSQRLFAARPGESLLG